MYEAVRLHLWKKLACRRNVKFVKSRLRHRALVHCGTPDYVSRLYTVVPDYCIASRLYSLRTQPCFLV